MPHAPDDTAPIDGRSLAASLVPVLGRACEGRLDDIHWFRTDWQRGGAATATAQWRLDEAPPAAVVLKLPVGPRELDWLCRLQVENEDDPVVPRVYASGTELAGYDLGWVVMERLPHGPLGLDWTDDHVPRMAEAVARFHALAARFEVDQPARIEPWAELVREATDAVRRNDLPEKPRWQSALKGLRGRLASFVDPWEARDTEHWLHGDAHFANAMSRHGQDEGTVCLVDLAEVHAGHWIEDAVYLERQLWARPQRMKPHRPVKAVADARKAQGLPVGEDWPKLAMIRRALLAATAPRFLRTEGHPAHLNACIDWLERAMNEVK